MNDEIDRLTAELSRRNKHCQDCPTFVEADAIVDKLSAEVRKLNDEIEESFSAGWTFAAADTKRCNRTGYHVAAKRKEWREYRNSVPDGCTPVALTPVSGTQLPNCTKCRKPARVYDNDGVCADCWPDIDDGLCPECNLLLDEGYCHSCDDGREDE